MAINLLHFVFFFGFLKKKFPKAVIELLFAAGESDGTAQSSARFSSGRSAVHLPSGFSSGRSPVQSSASFSPVRPMAASSPLVFFFHSLA